MLFKNRCNDRGCPSRDECTRFDRVKAPEQSYFLKPREGGEAQCQHFKPQIAETFA